MQGRCGQLIRPFRVCDSGPPFFGESLETIVRFQNVPTTAIIHRFPIGDQMLFVCIQANAPDWTQSDMTALVVAANEDVKRTVVTHLPSRFGESLLRLIVGDGRYLERWGFYFLSFSVSADAVEVSWAGDLRLHMIADGVIVRATKDHTIANERDHQVLDRTDSRYWLERGSVTRILDPRSEPPEATSWEILKQPFFLVLCSCEVHLHRSPSTYLRRLIEPGELRFDELFLSVGIG